MKAADGMTASIQVALVRYDHLLIDKAQDGRGHHRGLSLLSSSDVRAGFFGEILGGSANLNESFCRVMAALSGYESLLNVSATCIFATIISPVSRGWMEAISVHNNESEGRASTRLGLSSSSVSYIDMGHVFQTPRHRRQGRHLAAKAA